MPDDSYSFKATEAEMSFGGQINHIAAGNGSYCSAAIGTKSPIGKPADDTKATATKNLTTAYDYCIDGLKELTDADLQKMMKRGNSEVSKFELFWADSRTPRIIAAGGSLPAPERRHASVVQVLRRDRNRSSWRLGAAG